MDRTIPEPGPNLTLPLIPTCTLDVPSNTSFEVFDVEQGLPLYVSLFWASNLADVLCCLILDPTHQVWLTLNDPLLPSLCHLPVETAGST